jgi:hypothetical protein
MTPPPRVRLGIGCASLARLRPGLAEIQSLAAIPCDAGIGTMLVDEFRLRARRDGFDALCA